MMDSSSPGWREKNMIDIKSLTLPELQEEMEKIGEKKFRAGQIYEWMHVKLVDSFDEMTNLSKGLREKLKEQYELISLELVEVQTSKIDETSKFLFRLSDGNVIESVLMKYHHGNSVCISSQVGCRMGCRFCASTLDGLERGLKPSEMLDQIYKIQKWSQERVHNVVVMGTGEPLDNYDSLLRFIHLLTDEGGLHISQRNLTVSTCGIVPNMRRLADEKLQITLALSLHDDQNVPARGGLGQAVTSQQVGGQGGPLHHRGHADGQHGHPQALFIQGRPVIAHAGAGGDARVRQLHRAAQPV